MTDAGLLREAFEAGWEQSGEGFNAEYYGGDTPYDKLMDGMFDEWMASRLLIPRRGLVIVTHEDGVVSVRSFADELLAGPFGCVGEASAWVDGLSDGQLDELLAGVLAGLSGRGSATTDRTNVPVFGVMFVSTCFM